MSRESYLAITLELDSDFEGELADVQARYPVLGSVLEAGSQGVVRAIVYLTRENEQHVAALCNDLGTLALHGVEVENRLSEDWLANYRQSLRPFSLGRTWWIDPDPQRPTPPPEGRKRLTMEPRMAFGTGSHPSTHLVLLEIEDRPPLGAKVLDIGTGSGILSLASELLGASWTVGFDIDPQAVFIAKECLADQARGCSPTYLAGSLDAFAGARFDLVLCNMLTREFTPLLPSIREIIRHGGEAVLSGILTDELAEVESALGNVGMSIAGRRDLDDWTSVRVRAD